MSLSVNTGEQVILQRSFIARLRITGVRLAVASEYVMADAQGVRWRSLFRTWILPWDRIQVIELGPMHLFGAKFGDDVILIRTTWGKIVKLRPSAWCGATARRQWITDVGSPLTHVATMARPD